MKTCRYRSETKPADAFPKTGAKCKACKHEYYLANREHALAKREEYYYANRDACLAASKRYRQENRKKIQAVQREWRLRNQAKVRQCVKRWADANRERQRWLVNDWEARQRVAAFGGAVIRFTLDQFEARMAFYGGCCWMCGSPDANEVDHVKPIAHGGAHMLANLRPACGPCNRSKAYRWPFTKAAA